MDQIIVDSIVRSDVLKFIVKLISKKGNLPDDIENFKYLDSGYIDSLGVMKFMMQLEDRFDIEFSDDEMMSEEFRTISSLTDMIVRKIDKEYI